MNIRPKYLGDYYRNVKLKNLIFMYKHYPEQC